MLAGIDEDAVDFRPNYDGEESEPVVLPGAFPNLLANGAAGIAVGMATSIPPHNAGEICAAAIHLIQHPQATTADLLRHMPGPDFPTGGVMVEDPAAILTAYETGRGGFRVRAKWEKESRQARHLADRRHRNPLPGAEGQTHRAGRATSGRAQTAAARRHPRREHRRDPPGAGTEDPQRRSRDADGNRVPRHRAGDALSAEHERAGRHAHAARDGAAGGAAQLAGPSARGAGPPIQPPAGRDRAPAGGAGRLSAGLPQPGRGDPHHPHRGRTQAEADAGLLADRRAGGGDPEHAPARPAPAGGDGDPQGAQVADQGAQGAAGAAEGRHAALGAHHRGDRGDPRPASAAARWATAARRSARRRPRWR